MTTPTGRLVDGLAQDGARAHQFAAAVERLVHPAVRAAAGHLRRQPIGRRADVAAGSDGDSTATSGVGGAPSWIR